MPEGMSNGIIQISLMLSIIMGILYCFFGAKVYPVMHSIICGFLGFLITFWIFGVVTQMSGIALFLGIAAGVLCGMQCLKARSVQSFVLGLLMGTVATDAIYVIIFGLSEKIDPAAKIVMNIVISLTLGIVSCTHPRRAIVQYTAIIGASQISSGSLMLGKQFTFNYKMNGWFFVHLIVTVCLSIVGIFAQKYFGYHKLADKEDDHYHNHALLPLE